MRPPKKPSPPRVPVTAERFHEHLDEQIGYLQASCDRFDQGHLAEFKRVATALRTLVHDTGSSTSLLSHLGEKAIDFVGSGYPYDARNLLTHHGLIGMQTSSSSGASYFAFCQMPADPFPSRLMTFDDWWSEPVIKDSQGRFLTRRDLILIAANQDGGSHVDGSIDETYDDLARRNSLGWMSFDGTTEKAMDQAEAYSIRQIGWEVLETLTRRAARLAANAPCSCGSGRKNRYCCGKAN